MPELTARVRAHFRAWACTFARPGWRAIGTTAAGEQLVTATVESPEEALRALLGSVATRATTVILASDLAPLTPRQVLPFVRSTP